MTDIDTAAIRVMAREGSRLSHDQIAALCDALDAARAERDDALEFNLELTLCEALTRAEAAEAERDRLLLDWSTRGPGEHVCHDWKASAERAEASEVKMAKLMCDAASRADAAEENLAFAQQRAADNGLRAEIGERKIAELVAEIRVLRSHIDVALVMGPDHLSVQAFDALGGYDE